MIAAIWKNDLRHWLIWINFAAFGGLLAYVVATVLSPRRARREDKTPANLTPFLEDDDLESRRLERVGGWALIFAVVVAITLPIYWLREPTREHQSAHYFDKNSVAAGAVLFANSASPEYNAAVSLQCANCHGQKGVGGSTSFALTGVPGKVTWKVPALNTEARRFEEDTDCLSQSRRQPNTVCDLSDIITYGRQGTPMAAWGVAGGGPKNDQSISDLVAYIESFQLSPAEIQQQEADAIKQARADSGVCPEYLTCPGIELANARKTLAAARSDLDTKRTAAQKVLDLLGGTDAVVNEQCSTIKKDADAATTPLTGDPLNRAVACGDYLTAVDALKKAQASVDWSIEWQKRRANVSDGQLLFELNCARCHTGGWSVFDPTKPPGENGSVDVLGLAGGGGGLGGGIGFNLRGGDVIRRFGTDVNGGFQAQFDFVSNGSAPYKQYGNGGLGSGKMPGFAQTKTTAAPFLGAMLTKDQLAEIIAYERNCLEGTTYTAISPVCETPTAIPQGTTTTTAKKG